MNHTRASLTNGEPRAAAGRREDRPAPEVSVIVPTRNRVARLRGVLERLANQETGGRFAYEVLVVDNGSMDGTWRVAEAMAPTFPVPLRCVYESRQGRPWALNAGMREAAGRIFAFTDDDVVMGPTWVQALWSCFLDAGVDAVAGRVLPQWQAPRPAWLTDQAIRLLGMGCVDHGEVRLGSTEGRDCRWVGGNMAIRREAVGRAGEFDVRLIRGQDDEYYHRCVRGGLTVVYEPAAVVHHEIGADRLTLAHFRMWHHRAGYYRAYLLPWRASHLLTIIPVWRYQQLLHWALAWAKNTLSRRPWWERFYCELRFREDVSLWFHRLQLWPRWALTVLTGRSYLPSATPQDNRTPSETSVEPAPQLPGVRAAGMSAPWPFVSVVVPAYNASATIETCIQSLLAQDYPRDRYEVLVVDNGSSDETARLIARHPVRVLHERTRSSYAARNCGIQAAQGELIAFTDADCVPAREWLSRLIEGISDTSCGAFAGGVVAHHPTSLLERFATKRRQVSQEASMACSFLPYAITANAAYRKDLLRALGGFDDRLISGGDADLSWRLQLACGKTIRFNREAVVSHQHRKTLRGLVRQHRLYGFGTAMLYRRYAGYRKSLRFEAGYWLRRVCRFSLRGVSRLLRYPFRRREDGLYFAEHFLEVLCTTSRFIGIVQYHRAHRGEAPLPAPRSMGVDYALR